MPHNSDETSPNFDTQRWIKGLLGETNFVRSTEDISWNLLTSRLETELGYVPLPLQVNYREEGFLETLLFKDWRECTSGVFSGLKKITLVSPTSLDFDEEFDSLNPNQRQIWRLSKNSLFAADVINNTALLYTDDLYRALYNTMQVEGFKIKTGTGRIRASSMILMGDAYLSKDESLFYIACTLARRNNALVFQPLSSFVIWGPVEGNLTLYASLEGVDDPDLTDFYCLLHHEQFTGRNVRLSAPHLRTDRIGSFNLLGAYEEDLRESLLYPIGEQRQYARRALNDIISLAREAGRLEARAKKLGAYVEELGLDPSYLISSYFVGDTLYEEEQEFCEGFLEQLLASYKKGLSLPSENLKTEAIPFDIDALLEDPEVNIPPSPKKSKSSKRSKG